MTRIAKEKKLLVKYKEWERKRDEFKESGNEYMRIIYQNKLKAARSILGLLEVNIKGINKN